MAASELAKIALTIVAEGKGILAADESSGTIEKRFDAIGVESTEENRRAYRDLLFTTGGAGDYISGVILYDETIRQSRSGRNPVPEGARAPGDHPGIKVDKGAKPLAIAPASRRSPRAWTACANACTSIASSARASRSGARSSTIAGNDLPTDYASRQRPRAGALRRPLPGGRAGADRRARGADGRRPHDRPLPTPSRRGPCRPSSTSSTTSAWIFEGMLLKPNMVLLRLRLLAAGRHEEVAEKTITVLQANRSCRGPRDRLPVRRPERRGRDRPAERPERARGRTLAALLLVRPRAPGGGAEGVGRQGRECRGRAARPSTTARR